MGIVSSTFASLAIQFVWNCQKLLDLPYSCEEGNIRTCDSLPRALVLPEFEVRPTIAEAPPTPSKKEEASMYHVTRKLRTAQLRSRKRPSSFDAALIVPRTRSCGTVTSSPMRRRWTRPAPSWIDTSTSGCSSDSASDFDDHRFQDTDSDLEPADLRLRGSSTQRNLAMSADEEAAFRMTVGRGHFSRSKKDRFLNHLRLEKRLNEINDKFFDVDFRGHSLPRRHSGELRKIL
ncbi:uncharacterized protein LOC105695955 [Orussus abietinus]|uniref:uncharacterized protein LOC105695955 n=1 Tax=Orussus abietinus TaxID=222816 RepID=UPI00062682DD|nr:uncharacterized protein LOC105695955 [Orussus abietinus]